MNPITLSFFFFLFFYFKNTKYFLIHTYEEREKGLKETNNDIYTKGPMNPITQYNKKAYFSFKIKWYGFQYLVCLQVNLCLN